MAGMNEQNLKHHILLNWLTTLTKNLEALTTLLMMHSIRA